MLVRATVGLILGLVVTAVAIAIDDHSRLFTNATPPPREALERLNLRMSWRGYVPMDGQRDGFASIQVRDRFLFVQTRSGLIAVLDAETGRSLWRSRVGLPYQPKLPLGFNQNHIFAVNGTYLFALDHDTGATQWQFSLPAGLSAPPVADAEQLYLSTVNNRLYAFRLPRLSPGDKKTTSDIDPGKQVVLPHAKNQASTPSITYFTSVRQAGSQLGTGPAPILNWSTVANARIELAPVFSKKVLFVASPDGVYFGMDKNLDEKKSGAFEVYRGHTDDSIPAPPSAYEDTAYVGSTDANLYAIDIDNGQTLWRFTAGTAITREPAVTAQDVFVVSQRAGLARVNRATGDAVWRIRRGNQDLTGNPAADRFLAANPKFVYAADASGRLLVLDRQRGVLLSHFDTRSFVFPVANDATDRLYLAANNGLIVCLHDQEYAQPYRHRQTEERAQSVAVALREALNTTVTEKGSKEPRSVRDILRELGRRYDFQVEFAEKAFRAEQLESVADRQVPLPPADNIPLKELLQKILAPVKARFEAVGDTIMVLPVKPDK